MSTESCHSELQGVMKSNHRVIKPLDDGQEIAAMICTNDTISELQVEIHINI
jgi:hypothetical protein